MKSVKNLGNSALTLAGVAGLALAGGCCTSGHHSAYYHHRAAPAYASSMPEQPPPPPPSPPAEPQPTGRSESAGNVTVPLYQESIKVGKREVEAGSVRLKKIVKTETVNQPVELRHEELVIDRESGASQPAQSQNQALGQPFQQGETVIRLKREEAVVEKQTTPAGQIVVQTRSTALQTNIQAEVRREDIDIVKEGNPQNVIIGQNVQGSAGAGAAESSGGQTTGASSSGLITDPNALSATSDASTLTGRQVQLSGLKVRRTIGDKLLVLSGGQGSQIYVLNTEQGSTLKEGDTVSVTGTVKPTSGDTGLSGEAAQELSGKPFYIQAQKVEVSNQ